MNCVYNSYIIKMLREYDGSDKEMRQRKKEALCFEKFSLKKILTLFNEGGQFVIQKSWKKLPVI